MSKLRQKIQMLQLNRTILTKECIDRELSEIMQMVIEVEAKVKNLAQPDVSGNGVHPKNKRAHVEAVCEHEFYLKSEKKGYYCKKCKISIDDLV